MENTPSSTVENEVDVSQIPNLAMKPTYMQPLMDNGKVIQCIKETDVRPEADF